jgi:hypothetical protein
VISVSKPLTAEQRQTIRRQIALIPIYLWIVFTWMGYARSVATPGRLDDAGLVKGHDFVHFYVLGEIALERQPHELYDYTAQAARSDRIAGYEARYLPAYGPQVAMMFAPLAALPYDTAWAVWAAVSALVYAGCWYLLWRTEPILRRYKWETTVAALGYPPFAMLMGFDHISALALAAFTAAYLALCARRPWLAGVAMGCLFIKPPLAVLLPFVLLYGREWRVMGGAAAAVAAQLIAAGAYFGWRVLGDYGRITMGLGEVAAQMEPQPDQMQSLRSLFSSALPWPLVALVCYVLTAAVVAIVAARCWRSERPLLLRYSVLVLSAILVDPHVNVYDLVVLAPAFLFTAAMMLTVRSGAVPWALRYACFYSPVFAYAMSAHAHVQVTVLTMVGLVWMLSTRAWLARLAPVALH